MICNLPTSTPAFTSIMDFSGGNVLGRWTHKVRPGSEMRLQIYFDRISRADVIEPESRSTFDVDFQHHLVLGSRHDVVWGFGYRNNRDHMSPNPTHYPHSCGVQQFDRKRFLSG